MKDSDTRDDISYSPHTRRPWFENDTDHHSRTLSYHPAGRMRLEVHFNFDTFCISGAQKSDFSTQYSICELIKMVGFRLTRVNDSERSRNIDQVHPGWI